MFAIKTVTDHIANVRLPSVQALLELPHAQTEIFSTENTMLNPALSESDLAHQRERCAAEQACFRKA